MSSVKIVLNKNVYHPGEVVMGKAIITFDKPTKTKDIIFKVKCKEVCSHSTGRKYHTIIDIDKKLEEDKNFTSSTNEYDFEFGLPENAPASYKSPKIRITYKIIVKCNTKPRSDLKLVKEIPVAFPNVKLISKTCTRSQPNLTINLKKNIFNAGECIYGMLVMGKNFSIPRLNKINIRLICTEYLFASENTDTEEYSSIMNAIEIKDIKNFLVSGKIQFILPIPQNSASTYKTNHSGLRYFIESELDMFENSVIANKEIGIYNPVQWMYHL